MTCQRGSVAYLDRDRNKTSCYVICPDLMIFRRYSVWYPSYKEFSFWVNGLMILSLVIMGSIGIALTLLSIRNNRGQYRLKWHVRLLCVWDALALSSMFGLSAVPSLCYKTSEIYGPSSYLIRIFLPISNMANLGSMWQIIAIAAERFIAVTYPFKYHTISNKSVKRISILIAVGTIIIYCPIVFETETTYCFNLMKKHLTPMIKQHDYVRSEAYKWICNRIPSFLLRSPIPFVLLVFLTAGTIQGRSSRMRLSSNSYRHGHQRKGCNTAITLTIINIKFIMLQSLPVAYDIMNIFSTLSQRHQFYLADISNLLLTLQSATNWLVFLQWTEESRVESISKRLKRGQIAFTELEIQNLKQMYDDNLKDRMDTVMVEFKEALTMTRGSICDTERTTFDDERHENISMSTNDDFDLLTLKPELLDSVFSNLTAQPLGWLEARDHLRSLGINICDKYSKIDVQNWADAKNTIIGALTGQGARSPQERMAAAKFASFVIREIKHGMLCQKTTGSRHNITSL